MPRAIGPSTRSPWHTWRSCGCRSATSTRHSRPQNGQGRIAPNLARSHIVLGFAELTRVKTKAAKAAFEQAIARQSRNPLAHFGLGLAKVREGDLHGGSHDIETAAALDVEDSVIRSYLGKAYFEEKRDTSAPNSSDWPNSWTRAIRRRICTTRSASRPSTGPSKRCTTCRRRSS